MKLLEREYFIALGFSLFGSLGLICLFNLITMASFHERHLYPFLHPFSVVAGTFSLMVCITLLILNTYCFKLSKKMWILMIKEVLIVIFSFIPCFVIWSLILKFIGQSF